MLRRRCSRRWLVCVLVTGISVIYLVALLIVHHCCSEDFLGAYLTAYLPPPALVLPLTGGLVVSLLIGRWRWAGLNLGLVAAGVLLICPPSAPHPGVASQQQSVRIVTWNVHDDVSDLAGLRQTLMALQPDIVCLQEARDAQFARALPDAQAAQTREVLTLTRGRIVRQSAVILSSPKAFRRGLDTEIVLPQGRLRVLNVHYVINVRSHLRQASRMAASGQEPVQLAREKTNQAVVRWLRQTPGPRVAAGDFNTPPRAQLYRDLAAHAINAFARAGRGWGFTFPRRYAMIRIDHVWCAGKVIPVWAEARDGHASDHRLLVTDVLLPVSAPKSARPQL